MGEQGLGDARVLGEDRVRGGEHAEAPERHVLEVADRRRDHVEARRQRLGLGREAESREDAGAVSGSRSLARAGVDAAGHVRSRVGLLGEAGPLRPAPVGQDEW